jgi:glycosyltransferase involved in cell wall biosynthesis
MGSMSTAKPRILIVSHGHPALVSGGTELCAYELFRELNRTEKADAYFLGCVTALHREPSETGALQSYNGAENEFLLHVGEFDPFMLVHGVDSPSLDEFGRLLESVKPDIVHFHHLYLIGAESLALVRNRLPRTRIVFTLHDFHPICHRDGLMVKTGSEALCSDPTPDACHSCFRGVMPGRFSLRLHHLQNMLGLVDRFIAPSAFIIQRFDAWGLSQHMVELIPNGLPEEMVPLDRNVARPRNRFGYFGNIAPHKGPLLLLAALGGIDRSVPLTVTIHGGLQFQSDDFAADFDRSLRRAGKRVHNHGPYGRDDVSRLMAEIDWVVVPSTWWENAPLTILEAFRHGRPVIASNQGGMAELVNHGANGLLFRRGDASDLARWMTRAVQEKGLWERLAAALPRVPTTVESTARHLVVYSSLLGASHQRSA